jgi:hypothetical protein
MKVRHLFINSAIVIASIFIGLLSCEFLARSLVNPADYLSVEMAHDKILVIDPGGRDRWLFATSEPLIQKRNNCYKETK